VQKRPDPIKAKVVELIQVWSHAFRNEPAYKVVQDTFSDMKREGESAAVLSSTAHARVTQSNWMLDLQLRGRRYSSHSEHGCLSSCRHLFASVV